MPIRPTARTGSPTTTTTLTQTEYRTLRTFLVPSIDPTNGKPASEFAVNTAGVYLNTERISAPYSLN